MDTKNNKDEVICFRIGSREMNALRKLMKTEERPGVTSENKYARDIIIRHLNGHISANKKQTALAA